MTQRTRSIIVSIAVTIATAVAVATGGWLLYLRGGDPQELCVEMRDGAWSQQGLTENTYRELRGRFEDVTDDMLTVHGTQLIDILWEVENDPEQEMQRIGQMMRHVDAVRDACARYDVTLEGV